MPARHPARGLFAALAGVSCLAAAGCAAGATATGAAQGQPGGALIYCDTACIGEWA